MRNEKTGESKMTDKKNWMPNVGETYYFLNIVCQIEEDVWKNDMYKFEIFRCYIGNCFKTYEEAQKYRDEFMENAELEMKKRREQNER